MPYKNALPQTKTELKSARFDLFLVCIETTLRNSNECQRKFILGWGRIMD